MATTRVSGNFTLLHPTIIVRISVLLAICAYTAIQIQHFTPAHPEFDCDGYLILAKRMATFKSLSIQDPDPFRHQLHFWVEAKDGGVMSKFSPGYPAIMAIAYLIGGDEGMCWVSPLAGILTLFGAFLLFRLWMSEFSASLAVWILAINPMWLGYPAYLLTHGLNTCAITWGMFFLWKWWREPSNLSGLLAGLLLGFAVTVRYTSLLVSFSLIIAVAMRIIFCIHRSFEIPDLDRAGNSQGGGYGWPIWRRLGPNLPILRSTCFAVAGYSLFLLTIMIYNWIHFGDPLTTGYGLSTEQHAFRWQTLWKNFARVLQGLNSTSFFLFFPLGLVGMLTIGNLTERLMRLAWFFPLFLLYSSYYWQAGGPPFLRFFICAFPLIIGAAFMLFERIKPESIFWRGVDVGPLLHGAAVVFLVLLVVVPQYQVSQARMRGMASNGKSQTRLAAGRMLAKTFGDDVVVFSQSPYEAYLDTVRNFRFYHLVRFSSPWNGGERRHPVRTKQVHQFYQTTSQEQRLAMKRELIIEFRQEGRPVVLLITKKAVAEQQKQLTDKIRLELVRDWKEGKWGVYQVK